MFYSDDPAADFAMHDREQERQMKRLPVCDNPKCKKRIYDDIYFEIDGEILCEKCMILRYGKRTEDYIKI